MLGYLTCTATTATKNVANSSNGAASQICIVIVIISWYQARIYSTPHFSSQFTVCINAENEKGSRMFGSKAGGQEGEKDGNMKEVNRSTES